MQFTLTCRDEDGTLTRKEFDGMYLDDVVSKTQDFLHGVGFVFEELEVQTYPEDSKDDGEMSSEVQMLLEDDYRSIYNDNILDR
jgi:hypothetical protein|tara:strand:- start:6858 stop:7109 length:252 start_codon:yes stop_codon:yes gene_type:complete